MLKSLLHIATVGLAIYLAYLALLFFAQRSLMYPGSHRVPPRDPGVAPPNASQHWLKVSGHDVESWFFAPAGHETFPTLIVAHGNGDLIDGWATGVDDLLDRGIGVYLVEYPGFGHSGGKPSRTSISAVFSVAYDWLTRQPGVDSREVFGLGQSLGAGVVVDLAASRDLAGLILWSSFSSVTDIAREQWVPGFLVLDDYDPAAGLGSFPGPVLLLHGNRDRQIPLVHAERLQRIRPDAQLMVLECGHNDCGRHWDQIVARIAAFVGG